MFFFSKPFIGDLDYKIIRDCCKIWDEYWILRKNSWKSKCSGNARNQVRRLRYRFSNRMSGSILNIWILQFFYALVDFVAIVLFIVVSDLCQICWFLFDQSWLRRLKVMLLSCVNHTEQTSNEIFYLFGCSSIMYLFSNDRHMGDNAWSLPIMGFQSGLECVWYSK